MRVLFLLLLLFTFFPKTTNAQVNYDSLINLDIVINGQTIPNQNTGGYSTPSMVQIDLNKDGFEDLIIFDPSSYPGKLQTFVNNQSTGGQNLAFTYAPEYESNLPNVVSYVLVKDMNCDGIKDIIDRGLGGVNIHYGAYDADDKWYSTSSKEPKYYKPGLADSGNIYVAPNGDIPIIEDMDGDGDLDILAFDVLFPGLTYYESYQQDYNLSCDSHLYILQSFCYEHLRRADSFWVPDFVCKTDGVGKTSHSLSTTLVTLDIDGDGDYDILSGSNSTKFLNVLYNTGSATNPAFNTQDTFFINTNGTLAERESYLMCNLVDYNNDGKEDFVYTNLNYGTDDVQNFAAMKNISSTAYSMADDPGNFFESFTLDFGTFSHPVLHDEDHDGDLDLLISVFTRRKDSVLTPSRIVYLENYGGTATHPQFRLRSDDYMNISTSGLERVIPSFGDIDNDGDEDMLLGHRNGFVTYENTAPTPQLPPIYGNPDTSFPALDSIRGVFTQRSFSDFSPIFYDLDNDGDEDIISGELYGNLLLFKNEGIANSSKFEAASTMLGFVDVSGDGDPFYAPGAWEGYSTPFISAIDSTDSLRLLVGCRDGLIYTYDLGDELSSFVLIDSFLTKKNSQRFYSSPTVGELLGPDQHVILTGTYHGGLNIYTRKKTLESDAINYSSDLGLAIYPNPSSGEIHIEGLQPHIRYSYSLYNPLGAILASGPITASNLTLPIVSHHIYLLQIWDEDGKSSSLKIIGE